MKSGVKSCFVDKEILIREEGTPDCGVISQRNDSASESLRVLHQISTLPSLSMHLQ